MEGRLFHPTVCSPDLDKIDKRKKIIGSEGGGKKKRIIECFSDESLWILEEAFVLFGGDVESGQGIITDHGY